MDFLVADLKNVVQCSLCDNTLTEPKILPCFDTFCKLCIKNHAQLINEVNVFKCPVCSSETFLPESGCVEDLQPSLLHSRILKGLEMVEGEKVCSVSESHSSGSWYCFDCDRSMCDECKKNHSEFIKDHKVTRLVDLKKEDIEFLIARENHCTSHPIQWLEFFCEDCEDMICVTCSRQHHKDHKTISLATFAANKKVILSRHLQVLRQLDDTRTRQQQEELAKQIKQEGEIARQQVREKTKTMIKSLQENERELLKQIDEKLDLAIRNLNIIHHIPGVKEYIKNLLERGLASEMHHIQETKCSEKFIFNPFPLSSRIAFIPNQELVKQVNTGLGEIQTYCKTDPTMSTVLVEGEPEADRQQKLIIRTRTSAGLDSINTGDVVDVHIRPEDDVEIEEKDVRTDGRIEVAFMAKVAGPLTAEVYVNENPVSNSPLVMNVSPQEMRVTGQFIMNGLDTDSHSLTGIAVSRDNSRIAVSDASLHCVYVFNSDGDLLTTHYSTQQQLSGPEGLAFLNDAELVIAENNNHRMCILNITSGTLVKVFGKQGQMGGAFRFPIGVHVDEDDNIIVCDTGNHRVQVFTRRGDYQYQFTLPDGIKFDPVCIVKHGGLFYVSDYNNNVIHVFENRGSVPVPTRISMIGGCGQQFQPWGLAIDSDHHLLVCDRANNCIQKFSLAGRLVGKTVSCGEIRNPVFILALNDDRLLVNTFSPSRLWFVASRIQPLDNTYADEDVVVRGGGGDSV